ncbi:SAG family member [Eimeria mitis]|uniref:SAG family member n=1 Tax=Eimeria mitis TaxID=44415 RepID=U6JTB9_9EIME|nr:SAG family member [Eimeria mitis]CDJ28016.1 SAG family member [Eimeria mitis]
MAALKLFSLASASAFLMANAVHQTAKQTSLTPSPASPTYTVDLDDTTVCLDEMNAAREAAGLKHFLTESEQLTWPELKVQQREKQNNPAWDTVCKALIAEETEQLENSPDENGFKSGTYAFMALESETPDCAAAVSHWKDAASNFTTIPPAKNDEGKLYDKQQNISFVALYNPQENAAADCRVVTCTLPAASTSTPETVNFRSTEKDKHGYALLCMTTPEALKDDEAPFTEEQWKKIKASITGSASAVAPSLLAVAIAALGLVAL